jgi:transposase
MMHFTLAQSLAGTSTAAAAWLMVRAGVSKHALSIRKPARCPSCGRSRKGNSCHCTKPH